MAKAKRKRWVYGQNYHGWVWVVGKDADASTIRFQANRPDYKPPDCTKGHWERMKIFRAKLDA
jgi:hypothetical protein